MSDLAAEFSEAAERQITRLEAQKKNAQRVSVYIDGEFAFGVHQDLVLEYDLHSGRTLALDEQQQIEQDDQVYRAKDTALNYLAHKLRTEEEVRRRLRRDYDEPAIDEVIDRLYELSYLDDARYAREYVRGRFASKGFGPVRLRNELEQRGVAPAHIEEALHEEIDEDEQIEAARQHARDKWSRMPDEEHFLRRKKKLYDYLLRRGFSYDLIRRVEEELTK